MTLRVIFAVLGLFLMVLGIQKVSVLDLVLGGTFFAFSAYDIYRNWPNQNDKDETP